MDTFWPLYRSTTNGNQTRTATKVKANALEFDRLGAEVAPGIELQHFVDDSSLSKARPNDGITADLNQRVSTAALNEIDYDTAALLYICSSIGP